MRPKPLLRAPAQVASLRLRALRDRAPQARADHPAHVRAEGNKRREFPQRLLASLKLRPYSQGVPGLSGRGGAMSAKALQGISFFLLLALILYVAVSGGV